MCSILCFFFLLCIGISNLKAESIVASLTELEKAFIEVAKTVKPAVVNLSAEKKIIQRQPWIESPFSFEFIPQDDFFREFFRQFERMLPPRVYEQILRSLGSGVIIREDGYILTNNHVIEGYEPQDITVTLDDGRKFKVSKIVGKDKQTDLAVIKIDATNLPVAKLGDSQNLQVGQIVLAIGNPFGFSESVTQGIISALGRKAKTEVRIPQSEYEYDYIQTDAPINPGSSGGPLVNLKGEVIGINSAIATGGARQYAGIGFAIPIHLAKKVIGDLIEKGRVIRGWIGVQIQELTDEMVQHYGLKEKKGVLVVDVFEGQPASEAGIKQDDIIIEFNGKPVNSVDELRTTVQATKIGEKVPVKIIRDGKEKILYVQVKERTETEEVLTKDSLTKYGMTLQTLTKELASKLEVEYTEGIIVTEVEYNSPASIAGIQKGDVIFKVNRSPVKTINEFNTLTKDTKPGDSILLHIKRGKQIAIIVLKVPTEEEKQKEK